MTQTTVDDALGTIPAPELTDAPPADDKPKRTRRTRRTATGPADTRPDKAPRASRTRKAASAKQVQDAATGLHQMAGALVLPMVGKPQTGVAVLGMAEDAGKLWAQMAERYPLIGRLFTSGDTGMVLVNLLMLYAPVVQMAMSEGRPAPAEADHAPRTPTPADVFGAARS